MSQERSAGMTQARFAAIVDAYGGNSQLWPQDERQAALRWLASNLAAQDLVTHASRLDQVLDKVEPVTSVSALESRLLADFDREARRWSFVKLVRTAADAVWPGAPIWQPACALGLAFAVGLFVAVLAPLELTPDDGAGSNFSLEATPDTDAGQGI